jgi:hypothetical protein
VKTITDYAGRPVRLTDERLQHILEHPEMAGMEEAIHETLAVPSLVLQSRSDPDAALHYRYYYGTLVGDKWLCVVVKYPRDDADDAFVLMAYLTDKPKKGVTLWPNP